MGPHPDRHHRDLVIAALAVPVKLWRTGEAPQPELQHLPPAGDTLRPTRLWVDTDAACGTGQRRDPDDRLALLLLAGTAHIDIAGISTVFGNAPVSEADQVTRTLVQALGSDAGRSVSAGSVLDTQAASVVLASGVPATQPARAATFVVTDEGGHVRRYYAMAAGTVAHPLATGSVRHNMPDLIPVMVLARLAVNRRAQGLHLGAALLQNAVNRAVAVSHNAGIRARLVHALHEKAKQFYEHYGFQSSPTHPMTLMLRLSSLKA